MKKVVIVTRGQGGKLEEETVYCDKVAEAKKVANFQAVIEHGNVKHPSPQVLVAVLKNRFNVDLAEFYAECDKEDQAENSPPSADDSENTGGFPSAPETPHNGDPDPKTGKAKS